MARVQEMDQVMVAQNDSWMEARAAVVEYVASEDAQWVDVRYVDDDSVEQVQVERVEAV